MCWPSFVLSFCRRTNFWWVGPGSRPRTAWWTPERPTGSSPAGSCSPACSDPVPQSSGAPVDQSEPCPDYCSHYPAVSEGKVISAVWNIRGQLDTMVIAFGCNWIYLAIKIGTLYYYGWKAFS